MLDRFDGLLKNMSFEAAEMEVQRLGGNRVGISDFMQYEPLVNRFEWRSGPHDEFHPARVLALTATGVRLVQNTYPNIKIDGTAMEITAVIHDALRIKDDMDTFHGFRAAKWARRNLSNLAPLTLQKVMFMCAWHDLPDGLKILPKKLLTGMNLLELALMKDLDAADRFRNGDDLNFAMVRLGLARTILPIAKRLHDVTEARRGEGTSVMEIVATEAKRLSIMIE